MSALSPSSRLLHLRRLCGQLRTLASEPSSLLGEDSSQRWRSLLRNLGSTPQGQLKALQLVDSQQVLEQKQFQALLDDVAGQLPRDVGEKTSWESTSQLADVLKKLNVQSLHQRLGARLNNALLQEDAKLEVLLEKFCGTVADDYALWLLNRKLEGLLDSLNFEEVVTFLHLLGPGSSRSIARVPRLRAMLESPLSSTSWAKLMQIFDQEGSGIEAWEILDALVQQKVDVSNWKLPEAAVLGSTLGRHGLEKHSQLAEALLKNVLPQISQDSDVELNLLCISGAFSLHKPTDDMAQKALSGLTLLGSVSSARDALQILSLMLQLWRHWPQKLDLPKNWKDADFSPALVAELTALCASAGASFTGEVAAAELGGEHLASLRPFLSRLDVKATEVASRLDSQDFSSVALSLARLGLGHEFLISGDLESRLASSSFDASSLARLVWAMASLEASPVAWSLVSLHLRHLKGQDLKAEDQALLYEALSSQAVFTPKAFEEQQAWKSWEKIWSSKAHTPRSEHMSSLVPLLSELKGEDCEADAQIGQSPWRAPVLFAKKKIILDVLPTARHPASGKTRGDLMLKHHTWAETGHTVLVIPDAEWPSASSDSGDGELLKWIKEKVDQLHKKMYLQHDGLDKKVQEVLLKVELGDRGINSQGLERLAGLPSRNQMDAINKYRASLKDSVKNPTAWLIGIIKEQEKLLAKKEPATSSPEPSSASTDSTTAAVGRPKDGWQHEGRGLDQVRVGEQLMGKVTNIYRDRVWVDVGLIKDGSFLYKGDLDSLKVGQLFRNLKVSRVDLQRNWVELQPPKVPKERPVAASPAVPLAKKPAGGWGHKGGTLLAELQVGSSVTGKVTNVLHDRVWVDVGAESDATFKKSPEKTFKVGDVVSGEVSYIDLKTDKKIVRMQPHENT